MIQHMNWKAYLAGDPADLRLLAEQFPAGSEPVVAENGDGQYYLTSAELDHHADGLDLHAEAKKILIRLNAIGRLVSDAYLPVSLARKYENSDDHVTHVLAIDDLVIRSSVESVNLDGPGTSPASLPPGSEYMDIVTANRNAVDGVIRLLAAQNPGWVELYKVYELIGKEAENRGLTFETVGGVSKAKSSAFRVSANREDISGADARHAVSPGGDRPRRTMTSSEGRAFIREVAINWLKSF